MISLTDHSFGLSYTSVANTKRHARVDGTLLLLHDCQIDERKGRAMGITKFGDLEDQNPNARVRPASHQDQPIRDRAIAEIEMEVAAILSGGVEQVLVGPPRPVARRTAQAIVERLQPPLHRLVTRWREPPELSRACVSA